MMAAAILTDQPLRLSDVSDLDAGHEAEERPAPRTERAASAPT